jgi:predicted transcriptional regulator
MPPKLSLSSRLPEIAKKMLDSRIYFLPVIDNNGKFEGIVSVNRLINFIIKNELLSGNKDRILFSPRNIITVTENEEIDTVLALMHKENNSKAVILDENNKVKGIVSRYDLKEVKLKDIRNSRGGNRGEKPESKEPIKNYDEKSNCYFTKIPNFSQPTNNYSQ